MKVSIVVPAYLPHKKNLFLLQRAFDSLRAQTFTEFNTIVVLNGLFEKPETIIDFLKPPPNTEFFDLQGKSSGAIARNFGFSKSDALYVAQLDADDQYHPDKLSEQLSIFENDSSLDIVGCLAMTVLEDGSMHESVFSPGQYQFHGQIAAGLDYENMMCHSSVMFKKESLLKLGGYDTRYKPGTVWPNYGRPMWEDWDLWLRARNAGLKMHNIPQRLYYWSAGTSVER